MVSSKLLDCSWASFKAVLKHCSRLSGSKRGYMSFSIDSLDIWDYYYRESLGGKRCKLQNVFYTLLLFRSFWMLQTQIDIWMNSWSFEGMVPRFGGKNVIRTLRNNRTVEPLIIKNGRHQHRAGQAVLRGNVQVGKYLIPTAADPSNILEFLSLKLEALRFAAAAALNKPQFRGTSARSSSV